MEERRRREKLAAFVLAVVAGWTGAVVAVLAARGLVLWSIGCLAALAVAFALGSLFRVDRALSRFMEKLGIP